MKDFNTKRFILAAIAVFIIGQILDYLVHGVILSPTYESMEGVWRADMEDKMWIMQVTGILFALLFVYIFHFFKKGHFKTGWVTGFCYGFLMGLIMMGVGMFNQYAIYDITLWLTWMWFIFGMIHMVILGIVTSLIYQPK